MIFYLIIIRYPIRSRKWLSTKVCKRAIVLIYILVPIFCIPLYISFTIIRKDEIALVQMNDGESLEQSTSGPYIEKAYKINGWTNETKSIYREPIAKYDIYLV